MPDRYGIFVGEGSDGIGDFMSPADHVAEVNEKVDKTDVCSVKSGPM